MSICLERGERRQARLDIIFEMLDQGATTEAIDQALEDYEKKSGLRRGKRSETRATKYLNGRTFPHHIEPSSSYENSLGIDGWLTFTNKNCQYLLPVQVKSSFAGVLNFRNDPRYHRLNRAIIVLNAGPNTSNKDLKYQLLHETRRALKSINFEPKPRDYFTTLLTTP